MAKNLRVVMLAKITRLLKNVRGLKGKAFCVGGLVTEGYTLRDIDIVVTDKQDVKKLAKALGPYSKFAHFMVQNNIPPSPIYLTITGKEPASPEYSPNKKPSKFEYAVPVKVKK